MNACHLYAHNADMKLQGHCSGCSGQLFPVHTSADTILEVSGCRPTLHRKYSTNAHVHDDSCPFQGVLPKFAWPHRTICTNHLQSEALPIPVAQGTRATHNFKVALNLTLNCCSDYIVRAVCNSSDVERTMDHTTA